MNDIYATTVRNIAKKVLIPFSRGRAYEQVKEVVDTPVQEVVVLIPFSRGRAYEQPSW